MALGKRKKGYLLHVQLEDIFPTVWRRIFVDGAITLGELHHVIQAAMGWTDAHLHDFTIQDVRYAEPHPDDAMEDKPPKDEGEAVLGELVKEKDEFQYLYDFGDNWRHRIVVEKVIPWKGNGPIIFEVEEGQRACPPEDIGGTTGYMEYLEIRIRGAEEDHEKHTLEWVGKDFDPNLFDRHAANAALLRLAWNDWVKL